MASQIEIYNLALTRVGHTQRVAGLTDKTVAADLCNVLYGQCLDVMLRDFPWRFTKRRAALAVLAGTPPDNWLYQYSIPTDCLYIRYLDYPGNRTPLFENKIPFERAAGDDRDVLLTDMESAVLVYTQKVTDTTRFDPLFSDALADLMASELAIPLRGKPDLVQLLLQRYARSVDRAFAASLREGHDITPQSAFLEARNG